MTVFMSHKMSGIPEEEVMKIRKDAEDYLKNKYGDIKIVDNYHHENAPDNAGRLWHLGLSIQMMERVDAIYFIPGHDTANGCLVEKLICQLYGLKVLE